MSPYDSSILRTPSSDPQLTTLSGQFQKFLATQPHAMSVSTHIGLSSQSLSGISSSWIFYSEYRTMASTTTEIVWLRWLFTDMGVSLSSSTPIYCDNKSAIQISHNSVFRERLKHIEIDCPPSSA
ncbi:Gag-pol polyprotein [Abeliophyllum distichum]|uniref:Gag-pol polyprotein n=1 Tax=Abeliophyllum distichum TaxID=126358 RepID=A0ABD1W0R8_9LAMI